MNTNGRKTILIVEDEHDLVELLTVFFEENGYRAISAYDGRDGFEKAEKERPDLITLDISMGNESGVKMYRKLKQTDATKNIPVVFLTGAPAQLQTFIDKVKSFQKPSGFFEKPVDREKLLEKVKELIA